MMWMKMTITYIQENIKGRRPSSWQRRKKRETTDLYAYDNHLQTTNIESRHR